MQLPRVAKYFYIRFRGVNHGHATSMVDATSILKTANVEVKKKKKKRWSDECWNNWILNFKANNVRVMKNKKKKWSLNLISKRMLYDKNEFWNISCSSKRIMNRWINEYL